MSFFADFGWRSILHAVDGVGVGKAAPGSGVVGLKLDRLLEIRKRVGNIEGKPGVATVKIGVVGFRTDVALRGCGRRCNLHFSGDGLGELFGQGVGLVKTAVIAFGPDMRIGGSVDELHGVGRAFD